jgi:hypothetical protein
MTSKQVDWLINTCMETQDDLYYGVCPREVMEARYPNSKRTYTPLKDMQVCGADINIAHVRLASEHLDVWEALIANRKNPAAQARVMGLGTLFLLLTRQATLDDFVERVSKRIGIKGRAIVWTEAEPCMDVDKPHQLEIMRADLAKRLPAVSIQPKTAPKKKVAKKPVRKAKAKKKK